MGITFVRVLGSFLNEQQPNVVRKPHLACYTNENDLYDIK